MIVRTVNNKYNSTNKTGNFYRTISNKTSYFYEVPWSGKGTSFRAYCNVTCRDQLTTSCSCQTVHCRDHWYWTLTNGSHQFCTSLKHFLVELSVYNCLNRKLMIFLHNEYKEVLWKYDSTNQFLQVVSGGKHFSRIGHQ